MTELDATKEDLEWWKDQFFKFIFEVERAESFLFGFDDTDAWKARIEKEYEEWRKKHGK